MLKKMIFMLSLVSSAFCHDNEAERKQLQEEIRVVQKQLELAKQAAALKKTEPETLNLNPVYGDLKCKKTCDSDFTCQFPHSLKILLKYSLGDGNYAGGIFLTRMKDSKERVLVKLLPGFFKEIKTALTKTQLVLDNKGDITETPFNNRSYTEATNSIFYAEPCVLDKDNIPAQVQIIEVPSVESLLDTFVITTVTETKGTGEKKQFTDSKSYFATYVHCITKNSGSMGFDRVNRYRSNDWEKMNELCNESSGIVEDTLVKVYLTQCLWYQLQHLLSKDEKYKNHPLYQQSTPLKKVSTVSSETNTVSSDRNIKIAKKTVAITLGTVALATAAYGYLWYTGRGQQLPGMNTVFAPTFAYIATKAFNPLCAKVATVFGKKVIDTSADLAKTTLHTMSSGAVNPVLQ